MQTQTEKIRRMIDQISGGNNIVWTLPGVTTLWNLIWTRIGYLLCMRLSKILKQILTNSFLNCLHFFSVLASVCQSRKISGPTTSLGRSFIGTGRISISQDLRSNNFTRTKASWKHEWRRKQKWIMEEQSDK